MRRILVDHARAKAARKRGGGIHRVCLTTSGVAAGDDPFELILVSDLLEQLNELSPRLAQIAEYRIFGGLTLVEVAGTLKVSVATVKKDWRFVKAWLTSQLEA